MSVTPQRRIELHRSRETGWHELWLKEDWWAGWLGLGLVVIAFALFAGGSIRDVIKNCAYSEVMLGFRYACDSD